MMTDQKTLKIVEDLCGALAEEKVDYCHWKSNEALDRSASGDNDLDLLIGRADVRKFTEILYRLDFREARSDLDGRLPGILNYYGFDTGTGRLIHVHAHYQLVLGSDLSKNYRIPIERAYLDSSVQTELFRVPAPEFELVIFVLRMAFKHITWDSVLLRHGSLSPSEYRELAYLATPENLGKVGEVLRECLPYLDQDLFDACLQSLKPGCPLAKRVWTGQRLQRSLEACSRYPQALDIVSKFSRRLWAPVQSRILRRTFKRRVTHGGLLIAIVGGDGAGKTTVIEEAHKWLGRKFAVMKLHMGKPARSRTTILGSGFLKIGTMLGLYPATADLYAEEAEFPGYPFLIRMVFLAYDRYLTYLKARRFASNGGLVICDRYFLADLLTMDGPRCKMMAKAFNRSNFFMNWLIRIEASCYEKMMSPDLLIVLRLNPEIAVQRKTDETAVSVRARSTSIWEYDWSKTSACVVDSSRPKEEVLAQVQSLIWRYL